MRTFEHPVFGPDRVNAAFKALSELEAAERAWNAVSLTAALCGGHEPERRRLEYARQDAAHYVEYADSAAAAGRM